VDNEQDDALASVAEVKDVKEVKEVKSEYYELMDRGKFSAMMDNLLSKMHMGMKAKLLVIFLVVKVIPVIILALIAWYQFGVLSDTLSEISVEDSTKALNESAVTNIERLSTDTAKQVAAFLYDRDDDIINAARMAKTDERFSSYVNAKNRDLVTQGTWVMAEDGMSWINSTPILQEGEGVVSSNKQNDDMDGFHYVPPTAFKSELMPLYDELTYVDLSGMEILKYVSPNSTKKQFPLSSELKDISKQKNTYIQSETYWPQLQNLEPGEIYVSDVIGSYIGTNYIGMYTPKQIVIGAVNSEITALSKIDPQTQEITDLIAAYTELKNENIPVIAVDISDDAVHMQQVKDEVIPQIEKIGKDANGELRARVDALLAKIEGTEFKPEQVAYAGKENPNGIKFEGIVRWATPVTDEAGDIVGYVTLALNHDHIRQFVDHITPMNERYVEMPSAFDGNYAFIWDYQCRSIVHPRHHSIVGFDAATGEPQVPWLESSIYAAWQESGLPYEEFIKDVPTFDNQSREKSPAPELTKAGLVGLDGRYLNNAPQCTGWMDLTSEGGSGSFYILWSGLYKLNTAATIPYYTGHYGDSPHGFGFVAIGAGLEDFTAPATATAEKLTVASDELKTSTTMTFGLTTAIIILIVVMIAIWLAAFITNNIKALIIGVTRFRSGQRNFRFHAESKDEFGTLADAFDELADGIVDSVHNSMIIIDNSGDILYANDTALSLMDRDLSDVIGKNYSEMSIYPSDSTYDPVKALEEGHEAGIYYLAEQDMYVQPSASYFMGQNGVQQGYIVYTNNVSDMISKQIELENAVTAANKANEHKSDFLARMSHEIRTPMNAILGVTSIARKKLDSIDDNSPEIDDVIHDFDQIETSSQHLLGLINDILDISKIEAGKIELSEEIMNIKKLEDTVVSVISPRCKEKNIQLVQEFDDIKPGIFYCDALRLRQTLINLMGNAVKFTPEMGVITLGVKLLQETPEKSLIRFFVRDTGIGISPEKQANIFQPFEQADKNINKAFGGTGLGLAISNHIVHLLGSDIRVESEPKKGSEFSFEIWLNHSKEDSIVQVDIAGLGGKFVGKKALVVDDVEINRIIVLSQLQESGLSVDEANDGDVAVEMFAASEVGTYDIIYMDIQMPIMDGYKASEIIRSMDRPDAKTVPIIALTANAFKEDIEKAIASGMNSHIAKPVEEEKLFEALVRYVGLSE
jgi:signal transduction histidine kinase